MNNKKKQINKILHSCGSSVSVQFYQQMHKMQNGEDQLYWHQNLAERIKEQFLCVREKVNINCQVTIS